MAITVKLRNKAGEFCTFREYSQEDHYVKLQKRSSPRSAADNLADDRELVLQAQRIVEIALALKLPAEIKDSYGTYVAILANGTYEGCSLETITATIDAIQEENEEMARLWTATEYTIP